MTHHFILRNSVWQTLLNNLGFTLLGYDSLVHRLPLSVALLPRELHRLTLLLPVIVGDGAISINAQEHGLLQLQ